LLETKIERYNFCREQTAHNNYLIQTTFPVQKLK